MTESYARPELLAETDWLAAHLDDPDVRVVDCRFFYDRDGRAVCAAGHIPGAVHVNWPTDLADTTQAVKNLAPSPEQVDRVMSRLGIGNATTVVGYDQEGGHFAARLWWVLAYYGHDRVKILNGGIQKWEAEGRPLSAGEDSPGGPSGAPRQTARFIPGPPREEIRLRGPALLSTLDSPNLVLLDVRRRSEFVGEERRAARGGRIPGARHLFWQDNLNPDGTFRGAAEIRRRHEAVGATPDRAIVAYCQAGVRASHAAFCLALIGYPHVRMYDGSWAEWGNDPGLPIEAG